MKKIGWIILCTAIFMFLTTTPDTSPQHGHYITVNKSTYCIGETVVVQIFVPGSGEVTVWDHMTNGYTKVFFHYEQSCHQDSWITLTGVVEGPPGVEILEYEAYIGCCGQECYGGGWVTDSVSFAIQDCGPCMEWLYITCNEAGYDLYVDGEYVLTEDGDGKSGIELEEGTHSVQLKKAGCDTITKTVQIVCGRSTTLTVTMNCDPCKGVTCGTVCRGYDLWSQKCVDGSCVDDRIVEANSRQCGYDPCDGVVCNDYCKGYDLWSQKCVDGVCVDDYLIEADSAQCGFDPCQDHCTNGVQDCGEYGVDCGGGCPFIDSDGDGVEDCLDLCPNSRCNKVDAQGCETDVDSDGVFDCDDDCPTEKGDASNRGCPSNMNMFLILGGIGGIVAIGGGLALWGMRGGKPPSPPQMAKKISGPSPKPISRPLSADIAARKEAAEKIAQQVAKEAAQKKAGAKMAEEASKKASAKMAEEASKKAGTKLAEEASKKAGAKMAEEASKKAGAKMAEEASKKAGAKMAEEAGKGAGAKIAGTASGAGLAGVVSKGKEEMFCPNCGEKLPPDSKFCSKCGHSL
jgi:hypothetical protein